jgi:ABC-type antimicrobial peptide transport system ATPase subunit
MIAMALALEPSQLIANEWTTALDVTTQVQILADWSNFRQGMGPDADTVRRLTANHHIRESRRRCPAPASRRR